MKYIADLHVHSKFSMATAKNLDLENLYIAAQLKGINVVGTGDLTHPGWIMEIKEKLEPAEEGFFKLKKKYADKCDMHVPLSCRAKVRFILSSEISSIYKKKDRTRKNHNLIFLPDLSAADIFNAKLDKIGNIKSDGRPILGIDSRDLFEILLESSEDSFLIPAHIWTPWFSMFGSKSGFDSIEQCFEDLSPEIFAVETGLSSDPEMNWKVKQLDSITLVSNSDAHSPMKLGREANIFDTDLNYFSLKSALKNKDQKKFLGTFEFYPEEGKYHMDGHRKCGVCFNPEQTIENEYICPVCQKPLTLGVMHRVAALADRKKGEKPLKSHPFYNIVPLVEIISEIVRVGPNSKKVSNFYEKALSELGSEFAILHEIAIDRIRSFNMPLLGEAIERMRKNRIHLIPGFDGEYGKIRIFNDNERLKLLGQKTIFNLPSYKKDCEEDGSGKEKICAQLKCYYSAKSLGGQTDKLSGQNESGRKEMSNLLNKEQNSAVKHEGTPLMIVAGPGTGKTFTLTQKIAYLLRKKDVAPENMLAVTFTVKAAEEMEERLASVFDDSLSLPLCTTFHSLCFQMLNRLKKESISIIDDINRERLVYFAAKQNEGNDLKKTMKHKDLVEMIALVKQKLCVASDIEQISDLVDKKRIIYFLSVYRTYNQLLKTNNMLDYEDIIAEVVKLFDTNEVFGKKYREKYTHIFVDEYQDLNAGQYRIVKALSPEGKNLCVIGDPDQSIYGFRGSDVKYFNRFKKDYPNASIIRLKKNYRSTQTILDASFQVLKKKPDNEGLARVYSDISGHKFISIMETATEKGEAVAVGKEIEKLVGGTGFHSIDFGKTDQDINKIKPDISFADVAVLYRTHSQGEIISDVLLAAGIPCSISNKNRLLGNGKALDLMSFFRIIESAGTYADFERIVKRFFSGIGQKAIGLFTLWGYENKFALNDALLNVQRFPIKDMTRSMQLKINDAAKKLLLMRNTTTGLTVEKKLQYIIDNTDLGVFAKKDLQTEDALKSIMMHSKSFAVNSDDFLAQMALKSDADMYEHDSEKVSLMTLHASKGLEFPVVFITGCEEGIIPYRMNEKDATASYIDEEKRLFFVGMTRAKSLLYLSFANRRRVFGKMVRQTISPFVLNIENSLKSYSKKGKTMKKLYVQKQLFV